jgi:hypothetical protein
VTKARRAAVGIWAFVVGDDWVTAAGIAIAIGLAAVVQEAGVPAWWLVPVAAVALLVRSVSRERRAAVRSGAGAPIRR